MSKTVIKIENLSKIYRLGEVGTGTLSHDLNRWWKMNILGQDDPYAKISHVNDRTAKAQKGEMVAALRDINLEVKEGEVLGIIGRNGAGKSTLLKILSRVTSPTTGSIRVKGRMASLLEVGTGFHPEMTGRENIYMNGTIMGMRRWEIVRKLDEIVEFAGVAKYLDTPVKRYSSGMTVRLGFAIAAHLEPEILIVDEVLAVGDAEFQKKAIGKMQDVSTNDGRTVLFVSHNMDSIRNLCNKGLVLQYGTEKFCGSINESIASYLTENREEKDSIEFSDKVSGEVQLHFIQIKNLTNQKKLISSEDEIGILINYSLSDTIKNLRIIVNCFNEDGILIFSSSDFSYYNSERLRTPGNYTSICKIPKNLFNLGTYNFAISLDIPKVKSFFTDLPLSIKIEELICNQLGISLSGKPHGVIHPILDWVVNKK